MENQVISLQDLGFVYSLIMLAYHDREELTRDVKWSAKL